jgi:hypothetical protein
VIEQWHVEYNIRRPRSALCYRPPVPAAIAPQTGRRAITLSLLLDQAAGLVILGNLILRIFVPRNHKLAAW